MSEHSDNSPERGMGPGVLVAAFPPLLFTSSVADPQPNLTRMLFLGRFNLSGSEIINRKKLHNDFSTSSPFCLT